MWFYFLLKTPGFILTLKYWKENHTQKARNCLQKGGFECSKHRSSHSLAIARCLLVSYIRNKIYDLYQENSREAEMKTGHKKQTAQKVLARISACFPSFLQSPFDHINSAGVQNPYVLRECWLQSPKQEDRRKARRQRQSSQLRYCKSLCFWLQHPLS